MPTTEETLGACVGKTINGLEVLKLLPRNAQGDFKYWLRCQCGTEFSAGVYNVQRGNTVSCGCRIKNGYLRQTDEKLVQAYLKNKKDAERIRAAFVARNLPEPIYTENG
jgi:hypothetical protein